MSEPVEGQLRGIGIRLDPQEILIAPHSKGGLSWGYTIIDKSQIPSMFIAGEWRDVVPEGVWNQMLDNWEDIAKTSKDVIDNNPSYLEYPEVKALFNQ
jgi:hypothetical protein